MPVPEGMQGAYAGSAIRDWEEREARWAKEREVRPLSDHRSLIALAIVERERYHGQRDRVRGEVYETKQGKLTLAPFRPHAHLQEAAKPKVLQREEWMLKPPEAGDILSSEFAYLLLFEVDIPVSPDLIRRVLSPCL